MVEHGSCIAREKATAMVAEKTDTLMCWEGAEWLHKEAQLHNELKAPGLFIAHLGLQRNWQTHS